MNCGRLVKAFEVTIQLLIQNCCIVGFPIVVGDPYPPPNQCPT